MYHLILNNYINLISVPVYGVIVYLVHFGPVCFRHMSYLVSRTTDLHNWEALQLLVDEDHKRV